MFCSQIGDTALLKSLTEENSDIACMLIESNTITDFDHENLVSHILNAYQHVLVLISSISGVVFPQDGDCASRIANNLGLVDPIRLLLSRGVDVAVTRGKARRVNDDQIKLMIDAHIAQK